MFLPDNLKDQSTEFAEKVRREAYVRIEDWSMEAIPSSIRNGVNVSVQEIECNDPNCAPIDTAVAILFPSGGRGMLGLPMEARQVQQTDLLEGFPTPTVLTKWYKGEEAEWPPFDDPDEDSEFDEITRPTLRFQVGSRVECRVGPDPVTGWARGQVDQLWYREQTWPEDSWAPYKVRLDDGRFIFAPSDLDQIVRHEQT